MSALARCGEMHAAELTVPLVTQGHPTRHFPGGAHGEEAFSPEMAEELFPSGL